MLTPDDVRDIVRVLDSTTLDEFRVQTGDVDVLLRRHGSSAGWTAEALVTRAPRELPAWGSDAADAGRPGQDGQVGQPGPAAESATESAAESAAAGAAHLHRVIPPLFGTFYRAPQPGAAPFLEVGSIVEAETVVGIVETMKMMNPVHAGVAGRVVRICLADAAFAEAGATLMLIGERS
jgi:acetyl-CoA carboxylase biotin carboxyl carrier protein